MTEKYNIYVESQVRNNSYLLTTVNSYDEAKKKVLELKEVFKEATEQDYYRVWHNPALPEDVPFPSPVVATLGVSSLVRKEALRRIFNLPVEQVNDNTLTYVADKNTFMPYIDAVAADHYGYPYSSLFLSNFLPPKDIVQKIHEGDEKEVFSYEATFLLSSLEAEGLKELGNVVRKRDDEELSDDEKRVEKIFGDIVRYEAKVTAFISRDANAVKRAIEGFK